ncbi:MAG: bifunctional DNA-formamidopyrimidine glycosylase/DNA-(apurinic or apyrimidinic site) lyase [Bacteriovoracaceae bacterium]
MPPELPEVETIRRQIEEYLPLKITEVYYSDVSDSLFRPEVKSFNPKGCVIKAIERKGKQMAWQLGDDQFVLTHLGMSGGWRIKREKISEKHTHVQFECIDREGKKLFLGYVDPRRFGEMGFVNRKTKDEFLSRLGVELTSNEFNADYLYDSCRRYPERAIKVHLLDQKSFAGIGNYMACEICALAGVRPTRKCGKVTRAECEKMIEATHQVINGQINHSGLSFSGGYKDTTGSDGGGLSSLVVFHQDKCGMCGGDTIKKIVLAQRGTYYCSRCQK